MVPEAGDTLQKPHGMFVTAAEGRKTLAPGYLDAIESWLQKTLNH